MQTQPFSNNINAGKLIALESPKAIDTADTFENMSDEFRNFIQHLRPQWLNEFFTKLTMQRGKESFLVFRSNKYINVPTENIAFFYIRYESPMIMCFDKQEYFVNYSLEQIQKLLPEKQFYRLNRQYLINFSAVREVEHYFARKLLVNPVIPTKDKLIVSKEKVTDFLHWLDNR